MDFLRTLRAPAAVAGSYLATIKLTKLMAGDLPYEANTFWKALAHVLPVRNSDFLPNPTPWVYSREYLGCLGRNIKLCLLPTSSSIPEQLVFVTEDMLPEPPINAATFSLWQAVTFLDTKLLKVVDTEWATYAILDTVAQDLASGSRGRLSPLVSSVWNEMKGDLEAFLEQEDAYLDAIEETAAPIAAAFRTTTESDDDWEDDTLGEDVRAQIQDLSTMLRRIAIKHRRELEQVIRVSNNQAKRLVWRNRKFRQTAVNAQEKVTGLEDVQKTLTTKNERLEDQVRQLTEQAELNANGEDSLKITQADLLTELGKAEDDNERLVEEIENIRMDLTTIRADLAGSNAKISGLESQATALNDNVAAAENARDEAIDAKLALDEEYKLVNDCCDDAENAKEEAEKKLIEERKAHEEAYSFLQADHSKLVTDYKALETNYDSAAKSADDAVEELVDVKDTARLLKAEVERLKADKASEDAKKDSLNDMSNEVSKAKETISELRDEIKKTEADNAESEHVLEDRIDELQAEVIRAEVGAHDKALALEEEINELKDEVVTWQETSEAHAAELEALEEAKNTAVEMLTVENDKLKELQANYNGERYNMLDRERRSLQGKLADQKQATLVAQGNVRRLEREVAALQKRLQAQGVPVRENDGNNDEEDRDNDGSPEGSAGKLPAGSNYDEPAGNIGSNPSPPMDSRSSGSALNKTTTQDRTNYDSSLSTKPPAITTVPEFDPFAGDFTPSLSSPHVPYAPADTPSKGQPTRNGVSRIPKNIPATSTSPDAKGSTAEAVPSVSILSYLSVPSNRLTIPFSRKSVPAHRLLLPPRSHL
jgi:hypothetical protein